MNGKKVMALLIAGAMLMQAAPAQTFAAPQNVRTEKEKEESHDPVSYTHLSCTILAIYFSLSLLRMAILSTRS